MSDEYQLPDVSTAYNTIVDRVHSQAFFHKLAQLGCQPQTEKEAMELLDLGFKLAQVPEPAADKQASKYTQASQALDEVLGLSEKTAGEQQEIREAALAMGSDPEVYSSALAIKHAEYLQQQGQEPAAA